jgi:uncharacterized phage protein (TIGR02218 family)
MKYMTAGLISFLNSIGPGVPVQIADLLTIAPVGGGTIIRLTSAPVPVRSTSLHGATLNVSPVVLDSTVYTFQPQPFSRDRVTTKIGLEVTSTHLQIALVAGATLNGEPWQQAAREGYLDGAAITLERAYMPTWGDVSRGTQIIQKGFTGELKPSRNTLDLELKPGIAVLVNPMPRRQFQPGCLHVLYDAGCALAQAAFTVSGAAVSGSTTGIVNTNLTQADHYFELGAITFTSGANNGITRRVYGYLNGSGQVSVLPVLPFAPANGDTFTIFPGCGKTLQADCTNKFNNAVHFAGFPFVPVAETVL